MTRPPLREGRLEGAMRALRIHLWEHHGVPQDELRKYETLRGLRRLHSQQEPCDYQFR